MFFSPSEPVLQMRLLLTLFPKDDAALTGERAKRVRKLLREGCDIRGWTIHALSVASGSVVLDLEFEEDISPDEMVKALKTGVRKRLKQLGDSIVWADGYDVETLTPRAPSRLDAFLEAHRKGG